MSRFLSKELSGSVLEAALSSLLCLLACVGALWHHQSSPEPLKEVMTSALTVLALVALLTEILAFWHREMETERILLVSLTRALLRRPGWR